MSGNNAVAHGPLVLRRGTKSIDVADHLLDSTISGGVSAVSEITLELEDPGWRLMTTGLIVVGSTVFDWHIFKTSLAAIEMTGGNTGHGGMRLSFRSRWVRNLKKRQGPTGGTQRNVSASTYVASECRAVGITPYVQPDSPVRKQISRDVPKAGEPVTAGAEYPSAWTTFQRLAREEGYIMFEYAGFLYFGTPQWCRDRRKEAPKIKWINGTDAERPLSPPTARRSEDSEIPVEMSLELPRERWPEFRPGWAIEVTGMPNFDGKYIVNSMSYDMSRMKPLMLEVGTAVNPVPQGGEGDQSTTERGVGPYKHVADAAIAAGWTGENLKIAIAVALAESGGKVRAVGGPNTKGKAAGSYDHGLWQINDFYHDFDKNLIYDALYNAKLAYSIWIGAGGNTAAWTSQWATFRAGLHKTWLDEAAAAIETSTSVGLSPAVTGKAAPGPSRVPNRPEYPQNRGWGPPGLRQDQLIRLHGIKDTGSGGVPLYVNRRVAPLFVELIRLLKANGYSKIASSGGYNKRYIKGTTTWSNHSWGLAVDFNAATNPYKSGPLITDMPPNANAIAQSLGMRWGGTYKRTKDAMHYEFMGTPEDADRIIRELGLGVHSPTKQSSDGRGGV